MSIHVRDLRLSALHVAISRDMYLQGGFLERTDDKLTSWPWLHMHVRFGNVEGAVWANRKKNLYLLVKLDPKSGKMVPVSKLGPKELDAFKEKEGVFWELASRS